MDGVFVCKKEKERREMNTFWGEVIEKFSTIAIPRIDFITGENKEWRGCLIITHSSVGTYFWLLFWLTIGGSLFQVFLTVIQLLRLHTTCNSMSNLMFMLWHWKAWIPSWDFNWNCFLHVDILDIVNQLALNHTAANNNTNY